MIYLDIINEVRDASAHRPIDRSKRTDVLICDQETIRPHGMQAKQYMRTINKKYMDKYGKPIPYHYYIENNGQVYSVKQDALISDVGIFEGSANDVIILSESPTASINSEGLEDKIAELCALICTKYKLDSANIQFFPYDTEHGFGRTGPQISIIEKTAKSLEKNNPYLVLKHSSERQKKTHIDAGVNIINESRRLTSRNVADITGIPVEIINGINQKDESVTPLNLQLFSTYLPPFFLALETAKSVVIKSANSIGKMANSVLSQVKAHNDYSDISNGSGVLTVGNAPGGDNLKGLMAEKSRSSANIYTESTKPYSIDSLNKSELPGYQNAYFEFLNTRTNETKVIGFMFSPNSVSHSMSNNFQISKTMSGWHIMRAGKNLQSINLTGYMMDSKHCQERHDFIENYYKEHVEDRRNGNNEYMNDWIANLIIEGRKYIGFFQGFSIQKSSIQPFLYQYNIGFMAIDDILLYREGSTEYKRTPSVPSTPSISGQNSAPAPISVSSVVAKILMGVK